MKHLISSLALTLGGVAAVAADLPPTVAKDVQESAALCTDAGGKPDTGKAVTRADLNGDGHGDFVFFAGGINCDGAFSIYGDREKYLTVHAGDSKGGAKAAFAGSVYDIRLDDTAKPARLWLTVSGQSCGRKPAADFASEAFCERYLVWNAKAGKFDFAPVSTVKMIQ